MSGDSTDRETDWTHIQTHVCMRRGMRDSRLRTWIPNFPYRLPRLFSLSLSFTSSPCAFVLFSFLSIFLFFFSFLFSLLFVWVISAGFVVHWYVASGMCFCCVLAQLIGWTTSEWASKYTFPCALLAFLLHIAIYFDSLFVFFDLNDFVLKLQWNGIELCIEVQVNWLKCIANINTNTTPAASSSSMWAIDIYVCCVLAYVTINNSAKLSAS